MKPSSGLRRSRLAGELASCDASKVVKAFYSTPHKPVLALKIRNKSEKRDDLLVSTFHEIFVICVSRIVWYHRGAHAFSQALITADLHIRWSLSGRSQKHLIAISPPAHVALGVVVAAAFPFPTHESEEFFHTRIITDTAKWNRTREILHRIQKTPSTITIISV